MDDKIKGVGNTSESSEFEVISENAAAAREPGFPDRVLLAVGGSGDGMFGDRFARKIEAYDPKIRRSWTTLDIFEPREGHGCVVLNREMWTIGGSNMRDDHNSVRKLNLDTKEWSECAPMNQPRQHLSVVQHNGHIWAMGGSGEGGVELKTAERYDPNDRKWSFISPLSIHRNAADATVCSDKIYIAGGFDGTDMLDSVEYYDAATDRWILTAPMKHRRSSLGCASLDGVIYVVGGANVPNSYPVSSAERYDPRTGRWDQLSDMATGRSRFGIECMDGKHCRGRRRRERAADFRLRVLRSEDELVGATGQFEGAPLEAVLRDGRTDGMDAERMMCVWREMVWLLVAGDFKKRKLAAADE